MKDRNIVETLDLVRMAFPTMSVTYEWLSPAGEEPTSLNVTGAEVSIVWFEGKLHQRTFVLDGEGSAVDKANEIIADMQNV